MFAPEVKIIVIFGQYHQEVLFFVIKFTLFSFKLFFFGQPGNFQKIFAGLLFLIYLLKQASFEICFVIYLSARTRQ